ncbi:hypothetical protein [Actibacterium sp. 188UL27-1]|uniref:hypothetical protein n=1 Tax=Actibacterium sp. 188UL27-1 TaxID=2786961 RepID=UPI00195A047A|nr:hypothetical protein [Actibacterium sp. 188UL27-1]MBM7069580.1 hypothetical protein [Actibacterium sp. 188UL27-1]
MVLYRALFEVVLLANWVVEHYGAIYATFIIELIAMVALFITRLKPFGMLIGILFHIIIGFTGCAYYKDFSTIVLLLYALFLPREVFTVWLPIFLGVGDRRNRILSIGRIALLVLVAAYLAASLSAVSPDLFLPTDRGFMPFFAVYALAFYGFVIAAMPRDGGTSGDYRYSGWLIIPVLFFLNGWSPYLGLKTESSIAMFSNLHTEGRETNHLLHGVVSGLWAYQQELVFPISSNSPAFDQQFIKQDLQFVRFELDRLLAQNPNLEVTVKGPDGLVSTADNWNNAYLKANVFAQHFLILSQLTLIDQKSAHTRASN